MSGAPMDRYETERLVATRLEETDEEWSRVFFREPEQIASIRMEFTDEQIHDNLVKDIEHWERHGFGVWALNDRATGEPLGRLGLRHIDISGTDEVELLYGLTAPRWGEGLTTEAAATAVGLGFEHGLASIIAFTLPTNRASQRVMEKTGFTYEREIEYQKLPHVLYRRQPPAATQTTRR
jgi:[ribosomal protein S5]-alanine N-acetyltransferase